MSNLLLFRRYGETLTFNHDFELRVRMPFSHFMTNGTEKFLTFQRFDPSIENTIKANNRDWLWNLSSNQPYTDTACSLNLTNAYFLAQKNEGAINITYDLLNDPIIPHDLPYAVPEFLGNGIHISLHDLSRTAPKQTHMLNYREPAKINYLGITFGVMLESFKGKRGVDLIVSAEPSVKIYRSEMLLQGE